MAIKEPISLAEAKAQLRVEFDADDELISGYITAARVAAEKFLNQALAVDEGVEEEAAPVVEATWKQAILLTVANWYQNRETGGMPQAALNLLWYDRNVPV